MQLEGHPAVVRDALSSIPTAFGKPEAINPSTYRLQSPIKPHRRTKTKKEEKKYVFQSSNDS
jgi:hypothetical protein